MTDTTTTLTVEQQQRAEALDRARQALTEKGFASSGAADPIDLVNLASWIVDGNDPWVDIIADAAEKAAEPVAEPEEDAGGTDGDIEQCSAVSDSGDECRLPARHDGDHAALNSAGQPCVLFQKLKKRVTDLDDGRQVIEVFEDREKAVTD